MEPSTNNTVLLRHWLEDLQRGSPEAAERLWSRYVRKLAAHIRRRMQRYGIRHVEEDDLVVDVFASLCRGAERGRFPRLRDQDDLWQVLAMLTNNKLVDQIRKARPPHTESALGTPPGIEHNQDVLRMVEGGEPTPEFAAEVADQLDYLLSLLSPQQLEAMGLRKLGGHRGGDLSHMLQQIVAGKLENLTNKEIAQKLDLSLRVVERALQLIRMIWERGANV
jgi:RNA polymerase sigma factor (sigma-70 family)